MLAEARATIGHNSAFVGEILKERPAALFEETGLLDMLLEAIEQEISEHAPDLESETGRKAIATLARSIASRKVVLDDAGKALNEDKRKQINAVDAVRKRMRDELDQLRDKARKPLTDWEAAEDLRQAQINAARTTFARAMALPLSTTLADIRELVALIDRIEITEAGFGAVAELAREEKGLAREALEAAFIRIETAETERAELARLRAAQEAQERAKQEQADREAADLAQREREVSIARHAAEDAAAEERRKADLAVAEADRQRKAAEAALEAKEREEADAKAAEETRRADAEHRSSVMRAAKEAIMEHGKIGEDRAKAIVLAIAAGSVPNVSLRF